MKYKAVKSILTIPIKLFQITVVFITDEFSCFVFNFNFSLKAIYIRKEFVSSAFPDTV